MKHSVAMLSALLVGGTLPVSAQSLKLEPLAPGSSALTLVMEGAGPCSLPLPVSLEGHGHDLLLRLDRTPRLDCVASEARQALSFEPIDFVSGEMDGHGLHRVFMVDAGDAEQSLGVTLIELGEAVPWTPESGQWWPERSADSTEAGPGTGLFLEIQNGALSLIFATYDEAGHADWLMAAGRLDGRIFRGELLRFSGGQPPFGDYRAPGTAERVAGIELGFHSPSRAEMWVSRETAEGVQVQLLPLTRFLFGRPADARAWVGEWDVSDSGSSGMPRRLRFDRVFDIEGGKLLVDAGGRFELACEMQPNLRETLPQRCALHLLERDQLLAEFDGIGLNALSGRDAEGNPVTLSRR